MAHTHPVVDGDAHFVISSTTREITTTSSRLELMQGDHLSERITFEIPKIVEGHDMSLCDRIKIHYTNTDKKTKATKKDVYIVNDVVVENDTILFSWLISGNATKYYGSLVFIVVFECLDADGNYTYRWSTEICNLLSVGESFNNSKSVANSNSDALEKIKSELLSGAATGAVKFIEQSLTDEQKAQARKNIDAASTEDIVQADWSQNDSTAKDYVRNRTHYVENDVLTELLPATTFEATVEDGESCWWSDELECLAVWSVGDRAVVTCNGVEYNLIVYDRNGAPAVGNAHIFDETSEDTGEPFFIEIFDWSTDEGWQVGDICFKASGSYTISAKAYIQVYHTIDPKYIKDMYYTDVYSGSVIEFDSYEANRSLSNADSRLLPLALGQVWNVAARISETDIRAYENVSVQQSSDGVLYIGSNPPTDDSEYAFYADSYMHSAPIVVTGVSGTYTTKVAHEIPDKYIPTALRYQIQHNSEYGGELNQKIYNSKVPIVTPTSYSNGTYYVTISDRKIENGMMFVLIPNVSSSSGNGASIVINNGYKRNLMYLHPFNPLVCGDRGNVSNVIKDRPMLLMLASGNCIVIGEHMIPETGAVYFCACATDAKMASKYIDLRTAMQFAGGGIFYVKFINGNTADAIQFSFKRYTNSIDYYEQAVYNMDGSLVTAKDIGSASKIYAFLTTTSNAIIGSYHSFILLNPDEPPECIILQSSTENSDKKFSIRVDDNGTLSATEVTS